MFNKAIVDFFPEGLNAIILNKSQLEAGKQIDDDRKEILYEIYNQFGKLADLKLREVILSDGSPAQEIYSNPLWFYLHLMKPINCPLSKEKTRDWFRDNFLS